MTRSLWRSTRYLLALAFLLPSLCWSAEVKKETGKQVAEKFMMEHVATHGNWGGSTAPFITEVETVLHENKVVAYNMKVHPSGHILVPYHDEFSPVLLYSTTSDFIPERVSEKHSVESWVIPEITARYKKISERMAAAGEAAVPDDSQVAKAWKRLRAQDQSAALDVPLTTTVGPLIGAKWSQGYPFNYDTPFNSCDSCGSTNGNTLTGCVATAMGMLMKYWHWPHSGTGSHSYNWNGTTLSASYAHAYDWANMPNELTASSPSAQKEAVGLLLSDAGIAVNMEYGCCASAASIGYIGPALVNYFKYKTSPNLLERSNYTPASWFNLIKAEIDATPPRPMLFSIFSGESGHEVVIDGYQVADTNMVHVNLGWGGNYTGYYDITHDFAAGYTWSGSDQLLLTGIQPLESTYSMCGTVHTGSATGAGLPGATVKIAGKSAVTDVSGDFCVTGIASGSYTLVISKAGFATYSKGAYSVSSNLAGLDFFLLPAYRVSGTVHSGSLTGPLLAGATVKLGTGTATTGTNGTFSLSVAAGTHPLSVSKQGFATITKSITVSGNQSLNLFLTAGYSVSGTVHNGILTGPGLAGATVRIGNCTAVTNSYGLFTVTGVAPGAYTLVISKSSYPTFTKAISITRNVTGLNFALPLMISGTVRAGCLTGPPLAGAVVKVGAKSSTTDSYGRFSVTGFAPGTNQLTIIKSGYATLVNKGYSVTVSRSGLNFFLGYIVSGKVHLGSVAGPAAAGAKVMIGNFTALTNSYGAFTISGIPTGTYLLSISKTGYATYTNSAYRVAATVGGLNFYLPKAYSMSGKVHAGTVTGPALAGAVVKIAGKVAMTDAAGSFTLTGIAAGSNILTISRTGYATYSKSVTVSSNQTWLNFALVKAGHLSISYTTPVPGYDATGDQVWRFSATVREDGGVGVTIRGVVCEFYDGNGTLTSRQTNTAADFAAWFGTSTIGAKQSVTAKLVASIGGRSSGSVVLTLTGVDTLGHAVTAKGRAVFASAAVTPGDALRPVEGEWMKGE